LPELVGWVTGTVEEAPPEAVEVTTAVLLLPGWILPVWMGWVPVWTPVAAAEIEPCFLWTGGSACLWEVAWTPAAIARIATGAEKCILID
jgi:hypothetical protein